jgi:Right handed beta helix region
MKLAIFILSCLTGLQSPSATAAILTVSGSGLLLTTAQKARDGDTVVFAPGTYYECASFRANNLVLRAQKPGTAIFDGVSCEGKAIFVISGNNATVDGLVFKNAKVPDKNGAGIRAEGINLTIRNSRFEANENGILTTVGVGGTVLIENSVFDGNGKCDDGSGCAHGIYINAVDQLTVRKSTFINTHIGHHIKSRAKNTVIDSVIVDDGPKGNSSYLIDIPSGGNLLVRNSTLTKGPASDNKSTFISYAAEGLTNPVQNFVIENVTFISKLDNSPALVRGWAGPPATLRGIKTIGKTGLQFTR